jgi:DNA-binding transcriptional ArsR family regulator
MAIARHAVNEGKEAAWADTFKAMGDRTRLSILLKLMQGEHCVTDLAKSLKMDAPKVSFHLTRLKFAGLVVDERQGQRVMYRINPELVQDANDSLVLDVECCLLKFPKSA